MTKKVSRHLLISDILEELQEERKQKNKKNRNKDKMRIYLLANKFEGTTKLWQIYDVTFCYQQGRKVHPFEVIFLPTGLLQFQVIPIYVLDKVNDRYTEIRTLYNKWITASRAILAILLHPLCLHSLQSSIKYPIGVSQERI